MAPLDGPITWRDIACIAVGMFIWWVVECLVVSRKADDEDEHEYSPW